MRPVIRNADDDTANPAQAGALRLRQPFPPNPEMPAPAGTTE